MDSADKKQALDIIDREHIQRTQTPQAFFLAEAMEAHETAKREGWTGITAMPALWSMLGKTVYFSEGSEKNLKITTVDEHDEQMVVFTEVLKELLRERIMEIYRRNKHLRQLEEHERFELKQAYASYKSIKGNSYIDGYYATMKEWETVPDEK
jgi:hypothetical protein